LTHSYDNSAPNHQSVIISQLTHSLIQLTHSLAHHHCASRIAHPASRIPHPASRIPHRGIAQRGIAQRTVSTVHFDLMVLIMPYVRADTKISADFFSNNQ